MTLFGTRWEMVRNRDQKHKFRTEIYILVEVAWGEKKGNEAQIASRITKYGFYNTQECLLKIYMHFENEHRKNEDLGEIYPNLVLILPYLPPGIKNSGFGVWTENFQVH